MTITAQDAPVILTPFPEAPPKPDDKPVELDETGKVLMRAAEIVRERWGQDAASLEDRRCALTATCEAGGGTADGITIWTIPGEKAARRLVESLGFSTSFAVSEWNDEPERSAEEVAEALERAAYLG